MAKDPAFLFYPNDYIGGTMGMTFEEKGAYMELLMLQFNRGHMTSHMIGQVVGQLWDTIQDKFVQDENGLWYNKRLEEEKNKRKAFTNSRRNNISGRNQYSKKGGHKGGHVTSHMENEDENENIIKNELKTTKFERFQIVADMFDEKFFNEGKWLECYDKLIRIDKYSEEQIFNIVKEFRSDDNWWRQNGNFESLLKLRQKNKEGIKYVDLFAAKLNSNENTKRDDRKLAGRKFPRAN